MRIRARWPSKSTTFVLLMVLAALLSFLRAEWTAWLRGPFQLLGIPQWAVLSGVQRAQQAMEAATTSGGLSAEESRRLRREKEELTHLVAQQGAWLADLEKRFEEVSGLREQLWSERVDILVAPVIGYDASPRRDTLLIGHGAEARVQPGQWVAGGVPYDEWNPAEGGPRLVMRGWLLGRISEVQTYMSRVQLTTDPKFLEPAYVARVLKDGTWQPDPKTCVLAGVGHGRMLISQADRDLRGLGYGPVLIPSSAELPAPLSVGRITSSAPSAQSALHFDVQVEPWGDARKLRHVYVLLVRR